MNLEEFAKVARNEVIGSLLSYYCEILKKNDRTNVRNPVWREIVEGWDSMTDQQRASILRFVRHGMVETISGLFSILDGSWILDGLQEGFELTYGNNKEEVSGCLQDYFLAAEEDEPVGELWPIPKRKEAKKPRGKRK